jgi:hypothetical protein
MNNLMQWLPANIPATDGTCVLTASTAVTGLLLTLLGGGGGGGGGTFDLYCAEAGLVHGDFRLDNLMFDPDTDTVKAVLDWELATIGHPLADLAYKYDVVRCCTMLYNVSCTVVILIDFSR